MAYELQASHRFDDIEVLVPLPLHPLRERKRGFNQATVLCEGLADVLHLPLLKEAVARIEFTETQTRKSRVERWQNMQGKFEVVDVQVLAGRHVLLVDDVVTTGATLEACGSALLQVPGLRLSLATLCTASGN